MNAHGPLVVAFGNQLRCDDGAGPAVAAHLGLLAPEVHVLTVPQLLPELAETVAHADVVVFVDAALMGAPGEVACQPLHPEESGVPGHTLTPVRLLGLARSVFDRCPESYLVSIAGERYGFGTDLSERVAAAVPLAVRTVADLLSDWLLRSRTERRT